MEGPALLFGLGANKAGTSWLFRYLEGHPQCHLRSPKELHFFDAEDMGTRAFQLRELSKQIAAARDRLEEGSGNPDYLRRRIADLTAWRQVMEEPALDLDAYRAFLSQGAAPGTRLIGDMTPAYGLLSEARLRMMAAMGPLARFVLLLRDPVERAWSNIRMMAGWQGGDEAARDAAATRLARDWLEGDRPELDERSDYAGILGRARAAIPEKALFVGFYEELFTQATVDRICRFLGLDPHPGKFSQRVWASPPVTLPASLRQALQAHLAPQYEYVRSVLGHLPAGWKTGHVEV
ncbi:hypothetical protein BV394_13515 [Brevirhabdus pacifica]|uniref:Uncharacterized protein n=1 Tax=Brevirhabdus pacifica TaxID=1267768 RepID=A0A1U7DL68_9RHOB|nr:sulfotransferase [Brevirhabdus pacifica]APX90608.1 hypothetical protein BV394_13515 [Brevirhabdus pacifica]PJJ85253.1 sulfotransferase family protein [Brevirhabdus pacifica]